MEKKPLIGEISYTQLGGIKMDSIDLLNIISQGETSKVQFKLLLDNNNSIAAEMIAMANSKGGIILFGVEDKTGVIVGLDYGQLQKIGNEVATIATDFVKPQLFINTEVVSLGDEKKNILIVYVDEGVAKPYKDRNGTIWIKQGGDKRKLTDNNEQIRLFQQSGLVYVDEIVVPNTSINDIDNSKLDSYLKKIEQKELDISLPSVCQNLNIIRGDKLTLGGLLFFSQNPQLYRPAFSIKAVAYYGNDLEGVDYRDSIDINGTLPEMFDEAMLFLKRNLHYRQNAQNFNSTGELEISEIALEELVQNALTHRDYSINSPINLLIFDNRIEIVSPGSLPNNLTIENIKMGNAVVRNNLIVSYCSKMMEYRGLGSGIRRALKNQPNIQLIDDKESNKFKVIITRESII